MVIDKKARHSSSSSHNSLAAAAAGVGLMNENHQSGHPGSYEAQIYNDVWGQGEVDGDSGDDDKPNVDRALAMEVNIPLDHKGELVTFHEVRLWKVPSQPELSKLKHRINEEWIKPLNLKQQDIVRASGLGAPYVCYLLKDPNSPNMNRRRKIEAYSVLTELFRKYDAKQVTNQDFKRLRDQRVANRFQGPRQDRSGRGTNGASRPQARRRRRRVDQYGEEEVDDEEVSQDDDTLNDSTSRLLRRRQKYAGAQQFYSEGGMYPMKGMPYYSHMMPMVPPGYPGGMPMQGYPGPIGPLGPGYVNIGPTWPSIGYDPHSIRGKIYGDGQQLEGQEFQAPYPPGFPPVVRTITPLGASSGEDIVDGPPSSLLSPDKADIKLEGQQPSSSSAKHDAWVREKVSQLSKQVLVPKSEGHKAVFREPTAHSFVFLVERHSCLLPIGVKVTNSASPSNVEADLWDIKALRRDAEESEWLDENRDWDDCLWVLWDIKETGTAVQALFEKWRQDHNLRDDELNKVAKCFLSQYTYLRDVELSFQALLEHASEDEVFCRNVEINCDLLEERIRVKDAFMWDIRATDWDLTALLSNFVSDFQLDSPAISSLFIDLKTTILRYRKDWVSQMLERLTADRKIDPLKILPNSLGFDEQPPTQPGSVGGP